MNGARGFMPQEGRSLDRLGLEIGHLRFLSALIRTRSVTQAGEATGLSQPTASRTYRRLRAALADPILVRVGNASVRTPFADSLESAVDHALQAIEAIFRGLAFDPQTTHTTFDIAACEFGHAPATWVALSEMRRLAPLARIRLHPWAADTIERLARGGIDFAIHGNVPLPPAFHSRALFRDKYAIVCTGTHALASRPWRDGAELLRAASAYPHFGLHLADGSQHSTHALYAAAQIDPPSITVESGQVFARADAILRDELVAIMPCNAAKEWARATGYAVLPVCDARLSFEYRLIWHERVHRDPANTWARKVVQHAMSLPGPSAPPSNHQQCRLDASLDADVDSSAGQRDRRTDALRGPSRQ